MDLRYGLFMAEVEGHLNDFHGQRFNMLMKDLQRKKAEGVKEVALTEKYMASFDLTFESLTPADFRALSEI